ncbi:MAG TPA: condensation domain-containing protein [Gemmatimonadaceae bacterium]
MNPEEKRALLKRLLAERAAAGVGDYPLTHGQRALWFLQQLVPDTYAYNIVLALRFQPSVDLSALQRAIDRLVARHPALRTVFPAVEGQPLQRVLPPSPVPLPVVDMAGASDDEVYRALVAEHQKPFFLAQRAMNLVLFRREEEDALLLDMHHIVVDAWSLDVIFSDLHALYEAELHHRQVELQPVRARLSESASAEAELLSSARGEALWQYWSNTLGGDLPALAITPDNPVSGSAALAGASVPFAFTNELSSAIHALAKSRGTTIYAIMLVTTQMLVYRLSGESDVIIGTPIALRAAPELADVVGYYVNTLPVRGAVRGGDTFASLLDLAREQLIAALDHQEYPFSMLVDRLQVRRDSGRNPIFQVMLNVLVSSRASALWRSFGNIERQSVSFGSSRVTPYVLPQQDGQFALTIEVIEREGALSGNLRYQTALYSEDRATEIRDAFIALLAGAIANPNACAADVVIPTREQFEL